MSVPTFWPQKVLMLANYADGLHRRQAWAGCSSTRPDRRAWCPPYFRLFITILTAFAFARLEFRGKEPAFRRAAGHDDDPGRAVHHHQLRHRHRPWLEEHIHGADRAVSGERVLYLSAAGRAFCRYPMNSTLPQRWTAPSDFKYLCKVMIPLSLPTLISITILKMMGAWNSYIWPRLVANDDAHRLITNGLRKCIHRYHGGR